jgi:maltoporin
MSGDKFNLMKLVLLVSIISISSYVHAQESIAYTPFKVGKNMEMGFGSYGRIGVSLMNGTQGVEGRRLNLNNMGSIGGRMEEQDYLELGIGFNITPEKLTKDSTSIDINLRTSVYNQSGGYFFNTSTRTDGGLTIALPEMYVELRNIFTKYLNIWVGARFYRGGDVHLADYFYFNDHSGQGFGVEYKGTRVSANFIASNDTTQTVPPYFYLNVKSGTPSLEIRQRIATTVEQDLRVGERSLITFMGEYHQLSDPSSDVADTSNVLKSLPADYGLVFGVKFQQENLFNMPGSFNQIALRYGSRIANGGDGGTTRTWLTYGAPDLETFRFDNAYSIHLVEHFLLNLGPEFSLNGYAIYNRSVGASDSMNLSPTYFGKEVYNSKMDFTIGAKGVNYITDVFHWQTELHYSQRQDGTQPWYNVVKLSLVPTIAPRGIRSVWSRPQIRFVYSVARFNDYAVENSYSPYLELVGGERWGHYFGFKAEWWTW